MQFYWLFQIVQLISNNKFIMSSWKTSRDPHQMQKIYTQSNMKTNTSFDLTQSIAVNDFHSPHRHANSIIQVNKEELQRSLIYVKDSQINNNSSFSLQPTITPQHIKQFFIMMEMINFYLPHQQDKLQLIRRKKYNISRLSDLVVETQQRVNQQKAHFQKQKQELQRRRFKLTDSKKKKTRAITEETERYKDQIKYMVNIIKKKNTKRTCKQQSSLFIEAKTLRKEDTSSKPIKRKRIFLPYQSHQYIHPTNMYPTYPQPNPSFIPSYFPNQTSPNVYQPGSQRASIKNMKRSQQITLSRLKQAIAIRIDDNLIQQVQNEQQTNLDYFKSEESSENNKSKIKKHLLQNNKDIRVSNSSMKWARDDHEDKQLVQFISNSIKHLKTQKSEQQSSVKQYKVQPSQYLQLVPHQHTNSSRRNNRNSDASQVNITYDSQQRRNNNNKSSDSNSDSNYIKKKSIKNSQKSQKVKPIDQSNIKIQGIDMSVSKNSGSSKSDSSKQAPPNRFIPSLNQHFQKIQEQSEELSLKTTPILTKNKSQNSKNLKKTTKQAQVINSPKISNSKICKSPPNLNEKQQFQEEDEIMRSIKLDTQSKISKNRNFDSQLFMKKDQQDVDDMLAGINLLRQSKASREKALSMRSSINRLQQINIQEKEGEKSSQSQIFSKIQKGQLSSQIDSSIRFSATAKKNRNSYPQSKQFMRKGFTQPIKRQLSSIPSAQIQEEQDQSHSSKNSPKIGQSYR